MKCNIQDNKLNARTIRVQMQQLCLLSLASGTRPDATSDAVALPWSCRLLKLPGRLMFALAARCKISNDILHYGYDRVKHARHVLPVSQN